MADGRWQHRTGHWPSTIGQHMKIIPSWLREFVDIPVDDRKLAEDLTLAGISVESIEGEGASTVYDVDFTPNRVDAMNHYGVARDCSAIYDSPLISISTVILSEDADKSGRHGVGRTHAA